MKVICGGFGGTGSRIIVELLLRKGFGTHPIVNNAYDYMAHHIIPVFDDYIFNNNKKIINVVKNDMESSKGDYILKSGHLIFCAKELREQIPDLKIIITVNDPLDMLINDTNAHNFLKYGNSNIDLVRRFETIKRFYDNLYDIDDYLIVKVEDLVDENKNKDIIRNFYKFVECDNVIENMFSKRPSNRLGSGKNILKNNVELTDELFIEIQKLRKLLGYPNSNLTKKEFYNK